MQLPRQLLELKWVIPTAASRAIGKRATLSSFWRVQRKCPAGVVAVVAVCMLTLGSCSAPQNTSTQVQPVSGGQITPLLESTLSTPRWFTGTDGQAHLVYELMLTNVLTGIQDEHDGGVDGEDVCA